MDNYPHMTRDQQIVQKAYWELGDYYSRLGGAACPVDMYDSYIPTFIICKLMSLDIEEYTSYSFLVSSKHISSRVEEKLSGFSATGKELTIFLKEFYKHKNSKFKAHEVSRGWEKLGVILEAKV